MMKMLTTRMDAMKKQCRVGGLFTVQKPSVGGMEIIPVFNRCIADKCCHWQEVGSVLEGEASIRGRCGLTNPIVPAEMN